MKGRKLSHNEISSLCLELALFLRAGADSAGALTLLSRETDDPRLRTPLEDMARCMDEGHPLSRVLEASGLFPSDVWRMVRVGEQTGRSEEALQSLARYYSRRDETDRRTRSALLYPSILLLIMLAVIVVLLTKVLPIFSRVYASLGGQLTGISGGLLRLGQLLNAALPVLCAILALAVVFLAVFALSQPVRDRLLSLWQKRRGDRGLSRKMADARFAQALSMGLSSGLSPEEAVETAGTLLPRHSAAERRLQACLAAMEENDSLIAGLKAGQLLPPSECLILELGLTGGSGEIAMEEVARRLDLEAEDALDRTLSRIEPTMVVLSSLLVGAILLSVMLPLANIMSAIG